MGEILDMIPSAEEFLFAGAPVKLENKSSASRIQWWEQVWDRCSQSQREALEKNKGITSPKQVWNTEGQSPSGFRA